MLILSLFIAYYLVMIGLSCYHHLATLFLLQRVALSTAANMCKKLPSDAADFVMEAVPLLINLLNYHDSKVILFFAFNLLSLFFSVIDCRIMTLCYGFI